MLKPDWLQPYTVGIVVEARNSVPPTFPRHWTSKDTNSVNVTEFYYPALFPIGVVTGRSVAWKFRAVGGVIPPLADVVHRQKTDATCVRAVVASAAWNVSRVSLSPHPRA